MNFSWEHSTDFFWFLRFVPSTLFLVQFVWGSVLLWETISDGVPTPERCKAAHATTLVATPCLRESGVDTLTASWNGHVPKDVTQPLMAALFASGACVTLAIHFGLYVHAKDSNDGSFRARSDDSNLKEFLIFSAVSRKPRVFTSCVSVVSFLYWFMWLLIYTDNLRSQWLAFLNPHLSDTQFLNVLRWFTCSSSRLQMIFIGDSLLQGCIFVGVLLPLFNPSLIRLEPAFVLVLDFLHNAMVVWFLPIARYVPAMRPYNLYMISGVVRAVRLFHGVSELAKHYGMLANSNEAAQRTTNNNVFSRASRRMENIMFDPSSSFYLFGGQIALAVKIFSFLGAAALTVIAFEGWPCEYEIHDVYSPCDCYVELREFRGALYFVSTTMTTVGFGDIVPRTHIGRLAVLILIVCGVYMAPGWISQLQNQHTHYKKARAFSRDLRSLVRKRKQTRNANQPDQMSSNEGISAPNMLGRRGPRVSFTDEKPKPIRSTSESQLPPRTAEEMSIANDRSTSFMEDFDFDIKSPKEGEADSDFAEKRANAQKRRKQSTSAPSNLQPNPGMGELMELLKEQQKQIAHQREAIDRLLVSVNPSDETTDNAQPTDDNTSQNQKPTTPTPNPNPNPTNTDTNTDTNTNKNNQQPQSDRSHHQPQSSHSARAVLKKALSRSASDNPPRSATTDQQTPLLVEPRNADLENDAL